MADPSIQAFCCHDPDSKISSVKLMSEFNSSQYNTVCLISSIIGICGAVYQLLPRERFPPVHRWYTLTTSRGRKIIIWLAVADLLAALVKQRWAWLVSSHEANEQSSYWPRVNITDGCSVTFLSSCCDNLSEAEALRRILPNYAATYLIIAAVMILNPIIYWRSDSLVKLNISRQLNQYTYRERMLIDVIRLRFSLIILVYYVCWLPNLINGVILWTMWYDIPKDLELTLWYMMVSS
ncbi:G-protein coupled receptor 143-like [Diaphorina citri]|uniref:G-protein coupled receptor 143-like n=1 Tax=Diaphorina citri TaxID=121845 RepID=A0A3Q0JHM4_DIACI|nr:G-protein coupled receptor 143-like [Diaphorina citri]